jgi:hypothetical protein
MLGCCFQLERIVQARGERLNARHHRTNAQAYDHKKKENGPDGRAGDGCDCERVDYVDEALAALHHFVNGEARGFGQRADVGEHDVAG